MDFHGMKRKQLQALCKKHGVTANLTNRAMADRLASMFQENEEPISVEKLSTNPEEIGIENGAKVTKRQTKKVRFSPENQTFVYEVSVYRRPERRSRKQLSSKNPAQVMENTPSSEDFGKAEDRRGVTRSKVQDAVVYGENTVFSPPVGRKRGRRGMKNKDGEVNDISKPEVVEMGDREDVKNGNDELNGGVSRRQLRSRKQEDLKKGRKSKGGDEVHVLNESIEQSDVVREDLKTRNGPKQPTRNGRKESQSVELSGELEKVEVVSRVTRHSRAQFKAVASIVKSDVKSVEVQGGCEEVLRLEELKNGRGKNALGQDDVPQRVSADDSLLAVEGAEAEKPLRRSKRNVKKDWAKSATALVQSERQVTKPQEQSEGDVALEEPPERVRRYSSRRKSVVPVSGKGENDEEFAKSKNKKRTRTTGLDVIVKHCGEVERAAGALTLRDHAPLRRSKRKTVIVNTTEATDAKLANKEDIGKQQLRASFPGKEVTQELPRKSIRNASRYNSSEKSKQDHIVFTETDRALKLQTKEPNVGEEKRSVVEEHPITEKPQRRSKRITSRGNSVAPLNPIATDVKKQQNKYSITIIEEDTAPTESLSAPGELPAGKDGLVVVEGAGNKNDLDLNINRKPVKNSDGCFSKKREELRGKFGGKQCGFGEDSPFVDKEEDKDSAGNMEGALITTSVKSVGLPTDHEIQQSANKSIEFNERESNLVGDDTETLVHGGNVESEVDCMSCQSVSIKCALDDAGWPEQNFLVSESNANHVVESSEITLPAETPGTIASAEKAIKIGGHGMSDQEMKEVTHYASESLVVYKEDRNPVEDDKETLELVGTAEIDCQMNHHHLCWSVNGKLAVDGPNLVEPRQAEFESRVTNMEITSPGNSLSLADQMDLTGATSSVLHPDKQLETEPIGGESTNFASNKVNVDASRTSFGDGHINDNSVNVSESVSVATCEDHQNEFDKISGLKKTEEIIATNILNRKGIPDIGSSVKTTENQEYGAELCLPILETGCQKITEIQQSTYANTAAPETSGRSAPENQVNQKTCRLKASIETSVSGMFDQGMIEDLHPGNAHCVLESVLTNEENTGLVKNNEEMRIHDDNFEGEMKYQFCLPLKGKGAVDDSDLVEPRIVDFESKSNKVISPEITSPAGDFSSASQSDLASIFSSCIELVKLVETKETLTAENINSMNDGTDAEGSSTPLKEDQIKLHSEDANVTAAELIGEVLFNDLLNELGESIGLKRGPEISLKKIENQSVSEFCDGGIARTERSIEVVEKQEHGAEIDIATIITGTPNITEIKRSSSGEIATCRTPFGVAQQSQDNLFSAGITVSITRSEMCNQDDKTNLMEDEEILDQDNIIESETKYQPSLSLNTTDEALAEPRMVELESSANKVGLFIGGKQIFYESSEGKFLADGVCCPMSDNTDSQCPEGKQTNITEGSFKNVSLETLDRHNKVVKSECNANKVVCSEIASLADVCSSASQANLAGKTSNELNLDKELESEESPRGKIVDYENGKTDIEDNKNPAQKVLNSVCLEDSNITAAEPVPEVVIWDHLNEFCELKAEEMRADDPSGKELVQTESSARINEKSEATTIIHKGTAETGEKIIMGTQWSLSGHDTILISSPRPKAGIQDMQGSIYKVENAVSPAGDGMSYHQKSEENVKLVENENERTINTERGLFIGGKLIFDEGSEEKFLADGRCRPISDSTDSQCAKGEQTDIADGSFDNVSLETQERHSCEVFDGEGTDHISSEQKDNDPFPMRLCYNHVLADGGRNCSGEIVLNHPINNDFAATMGSSEISAIRERDVGQADDIMEEIAVSSLKVELNDHGDCKMDAELYDSNMNVLHKILQETDIGGVVSTESPGDKPNASVRTIAPLEKTNFDLDDQNEDIAHQHDCSSPFRLDVFTSAVGIIMDKNAQSGKEVDDLYVNGSGPYGMLDYIYAKTSEANKFDAVSLVEAGHEEGRKTQNSYLRSSHVGRKEDVPSYIYTTFSKSEISLASATPLCSNNPVSCAETEHLPQVMDDIDDVGGTESSNDCKVAREERDECVKNTGGSNDVIDGLPVEKSRGDPEELADAKSDDCEGSVKIASFMDYTDGLPVIQPLCLDESKSFDQENEEPHGSHLPDNTADNSREVGYCCKLDIVSSVKPEIFTGCSSNSSICPTSNECKHLESPDESNILTNTEMSFFWASGDEAKKPDSNTGDINHAPSDKTTTECNSSDIKEEDHVAFSDVKNTKISAEKDGPETVQETMETTKDVSGLNPAMADKSPLSKNSDVEAVVDHKEPFRSQLNLPSSQKKNMTAKKEGSKSVFPKLLTPSVLKSKSKSNLIQRTPKRLVIHDAKENETGTKMEQIGSRTTPKTSSKRQPLERVWKY